MGKNELPLVTMRVLAYNQEKYIAEAVKSVLAQDYPNLEIILSDDCSTDRTYEIIQHLAEDYTGPHKIILNRNEHNLGIREHSNKLDAMSNGEFVTGNAGDDISLPNRVSKCVEIMLKHPEVMSLSTEVDYIDGEGKEIPNQHEIHIRKGDYALLTMTEYLNYQFHDFYLFPGATRMRRRRLIDSFPPLSTAPDEDIYWFIRCLYVGTIAFIHIPLLKYRRHEKNITTLREKEGGDNKVMQKRLLLKDCSEKQLYADLDYSIQMGYVDYAYRKIIADKISRIYDSYISPIPIQMTFLQSIIYRICRKCMKFLGIRLRAEKM